jgi:hypothetical protein
MCSTVHFKRLLLCDDSTTTQTASDAKRQAFEVFLFCFQQRGRGDHAGLGASYLLTDPNMPPTSMYTYVATIDAIQYGSKPPLLTSPAALWNGYGHNYYNTGRSTVLGHIVWLAGAVMPGVPNTPYSLTHTTIGTNPTVLAAVEGDLISFYRQLPGN